MDRRVLQTQRRRAQSLLDSVDNYPHAVPGGEAPYVGGPDDHELASTEPDLAEQWDAHASPTTAQLLRAAEAGLGPVDTSARRGVVA